MIFYAMQSKKALVDKIVDALCKEEAIGMEKTLDFNIRDAVHLTQKNVTYTRKRLLPIIMSVEV